ncbi:GAF domain-containing protein [Flavobacteriaceae bacterium Ap0902]|nr:GAF domain-containing protein [Flavobacteriaceae bacterium Ap0902]
MRNLNKRIDTLLNANKGTNQKLQQLCKLLFDEVEHYNWVGFYFKNGDKNELKLGPYEGAATDHTIIPYGRGICGQVAESNETYVVQDVSAASNYLSCSIDTKAEIVVPIFKDGENIGQIDIDSHFKDSITPGDQEFLEELMIKVAKIL